jgi:GT2 family glycosyltransferase
MTSVSVVIASLNSRATILDCLEALRPQLGDDVEVVVADSSDDGTDRLVRERAPWARLLHSELRLAPGAARNRGVAAASGELIAFLDADCVPAPDWIARLREAQEEHGPVVGGAVDNGNEESWAGWVYYFCEFAPWMPGQAAGPMGEIPTCCLSVRRSVLDRVGPFREQGYCSDTAFHWRLARLGLHAHFDPRARVAHVNPSRYGRILSKLVMHGLSFARVRCEERTLSRGHALLLLLGSPLLPAVLLWRRWRQVSRAGRQRAAFLRCAPGILGALTAWSFGESRGYGEWLLDDTRVATELPLVPPQRQPGSGPGGRGETLESVPITTPSGRRTDGS